MDMKKEIKLPSLFKRRAKGAEDFETPAAEGFDETDAKPAKARKLSFRRSPKEAGEPKPPKQKRRKGDAPAPVVTGVPIMRAFNLLPKDDPRDSGGKRPATAQLVLAVAGIVLVAGLGSVYMITSATVDDKRAERDELKARVDALAPAEPDAPVEQADPAVLSEQNARTAALSTALGGRIAWDRVLRQLSLVIPDDVWLTGLIAIPAPAPAVPAPATTTTTGAEAAVAALVPAHAPTMITVNGYAHSQEGVARLLARLAVVPELAGVKLLSSVSALIGEREVFQFSVAALVKPPGGSA